MSRIWLSDFTFTFYFHALKEMATHSSVLAWRIPGTGEPGGLPSNGVAQSRTRLKRLSSSSMLFSSWGHWGAPLYCRYTGFSLQCLCLLRSMDSRGHLRWAGSNPCPCIDRQILYHWDTGQPSFTTLISLRIASLWISEWILDYPATPSFSASWMCIWFNQLI